MRPGFPAGSLLAALLGGEAPVEARRAARRLRAEGAPALAADAEIAALADGLAGTGVAHSPAVLDALPPLFWIEAPEEMAGAEMAGAEMAGTEVAGAAPLRGWVVEKRGDGLAARGFSLAVGAEALPEPAGDTALAFGGHPVPEAAAARALRGRPPPWRCRRCWRRWGNPPRPAAAGRGAGGGRAPAARPPALRRPGTGFGARLSATG
ncbi:hypothetical protein [Teichococcus aestuarii]|uniref:hypothetical protein n=1 Tax=Teichococcus aestuarii TaxID=568898 RepID=UPI003611C1D1